MLSHLADFLVFSAALLSLPLFCCHFPPSRFQDPWSDANSVAVVLIMLEDFLVTTTGADTSVPGSGKETILVKHV